MSNNSILIDNQYFPVVNWFKYSFQKKYIILSSCEPYQKMTFRNRAVICGSNGLINLSVPIMQGRNLRVPFKEVRISYHENWQTNHWRGIVSCYNKSPFFDYYSGELEDFFQKQHTYLFDLNLEILNWLKKVIGFSSEIVTIDSYDATEYKEVAENISNKWLPKNYQAGNDFVRYIQVFEDRIGFQPNVSILDLMFNTGPAAGSYLQ